MLAALVATLNRSPRNPIPNKENSRGTIRDFSFAQAMGHRLIRNAALWLATTLQLFCRDRNSPYHPANRLQALRVCCREACDCCRPGIAGCNRRKLQRVPGPLMSKHIVSNVSKSNPHRICPTEKSKLLSIIKRKPSSTARLKDTTQTRMRSISWHDTNRPSSFASEQATPDWIATSRGLA